MNLLWVLLITYIRPFRRTSRQSRCRCLRDLREFLTFITLPQSKDCPELTHSIGNSTLNLVVGVTGIEPVTPSMSTKCSPAELYARPRLSLRIILLPNLGALYIAVDQKLQVIFDTFNLMLNLAYV